jgi:adenosylcobyric acid synthase
VTRGRALDNPAAHLAHGPDGAISDDGRILGTYLHGLFDSTDACVALLAWAGLRAAQTLDYDALREAAIERLADAVERHLDTRRLNTLLGLETVPA